MVWGIFSESVACGSPASRSPGELVECRFRVPPPTYQIWSLGSALLLLPVSSMLPPSFSKGKVKEEMIAFSVNSLVTPAPPKI